MVRFFTTLICASICVCSVGCSKFIIAEDQDSASESPALLELSASLKASGLTEAEAQAVVSGIQNEVSSSQASSSSFQKVGRLSTDVSASNIPDMIRGAMKSLGSSYFSSETRRLLAAKIISSKIFLVFKDKLAELTEEELQLLVKNTIAEQVKASSYAGFSSSAKETAFKDMIQESIKASENFCPDSTKQIGFVRSLAESAVGFLDEAGLSSSEISAVIPKIIEGSIEGVGNLTNLNSTEKSSYMVEFILKTYDSLGNTGLTAGDKSTLTETISTTVSSNLSQDATLANQVSSGTSQGDSCINSSKWVFMYEYSDSRCQTLTSKSVLGPLVGSPMDRGFPDHAFCIRNPSNNKYYNWIGGPSGCLSEAPSIASMPASGPSPRNLTVTGGITALCTSGFYGGGTGGTNSISLEACESNALLNFRLNGKNKFMQMSYEGVISAIFDVAPSGISIPNYAQLCEAVNLSGGSDVIYKNNKADCIKFCESRISEFPAYAYTCKFVGVALKSYAANSIAPATSIVYDKELKWTIPSSFVANACQKVSISLVTTSTGVPLTGDGRLVSLWETRYDASSTLGGWGPAVFYLNSNCSTPISSGGATLPSGTAPLDLYVKPGLGTTWSFVAKPTFIGTNPGFSTKAALAP